MPPPGSTRQPRARARRDQLGLQREVDDVGDPEVRAQQLGRAPTIPGWPCMPTGVALTRPCAPAERALQVGRHGDPVVAEPLGQAYDARVGARRGPRRARRRARRPGRAARSRPRRRRPRRRRATARSSHRFGQHLRGTPARSRTSRCCGRASRPSRNTTVLTAPRSAASSESSSSSGTTACLNGWVTLSPSKPEPLAQASSSGRSSDAEAALVGVDQPVGQRPARARAPRAPASPGSASAPMPAPTRPSRNERPAAGARRRVVTHAVATRTRSAAAAGRTPIAARRDLVCVPRGPVSTAIAEIDAGTDGERGDLAPVVGVAGHQRAGDGRGEAGQREAELGADRHAGQAHAGREVLGVRRRPHGVRHAVDDAGEQHAESRTSARSLPAAMAPRNAVTSTALPSDAGDEHRLAADPVGEPRPERDDADRDEVGDDRQPEHERVAEPDAVVVGGREVQREDLRTSC